MTSYDEQIESSADSEQYAEVIVNDSTSVELYLLGAGFVTGTGWSSVGVSVQFTPREARAIARHLLAAADLAEDNAITPEEE